MDSDHRKTEKDGIVRSLIASLIARMGSLVVRHVLLFRDDVGMR